MFKILSAIVILSATQTAAEQVLISVSDRVLKEGEIVSSNISYQGFPSGDVTVDRLLRNAYQKFSLLIRWQGDFYLCDHLWEQVEGGAENLPVTWRTVSVGCHK